MPETGPEVKKIIEEYKRALKTLGIESERIILYGSFAKGTQREDSDIDVLLISKDFENLNLRERLEVLGIAAARIREPIEARGYTPQEIEEAQEASLLREILEVGVSVE